MMPPTLNTPPEPEAATVAAGWVVPLDVVMAEAQAIVRAAAARRPG